MRIELERAFARRRSQPQSAAPVTLLALSSGQEDGAFGAGLLVGWTEHGDRPAFQIVPIDQSVGTDVSLEDDPLYEAPAVGRSSDGLTAADHDASLYGAPRRLR